MGSSLFWSSAGLKRVAELVEAEARADNSSQKIIAQKAGVSEQTISNLLLNRYNTDDRIVKEPKPDTLMKVAPHVTNPATGRAFEPEEFLAIARGQSFTFKNESETQLDDLNKVDRKTHPYPKAVQHIQDLMGDRTIEQAAKDWDMSAERLEELLTTTDPDRAMPNGIEVHRISQNYPDKLANRLLQFYAEPQITKNGGRRRLKK